MENKKMQGYMYAVIMGLLTAIICLVIADGLVGVAGTIKDFKDLGNGYHEFTLSTSDPTGRYIFWIGLLGLPVLFASKVKVKYTWVNLPIYLLAWYICSGIFGESPKHRYLAHPAKGWITIGEGLEPFSVMIMMWLVQAIVLWAIAFLCFAIGKRRRRANDDV
ncbi:MAG: hypothetical protein J6J38_03065 [Lachnospiraceae bacterium]|nr:hypothetical protein [Lachnospiraceae bacterium]